MADPQAKYCLDPELHRSARLIRSVDHRDAAALRREMTRRAHASRLLRKAVGGSSAVQVFDLDLPVSSSHVIRVRGYRPGGASGPLPVIVFLHGGAFVSGDLELEHARCTEMCRDTGSLVVSPEYRLAPEQPYPAGLEDCVAVYQWVLSGPPELLPWGDTEIVAVAGSSAGGALSAALCLWARDSGLPLPQFQALVYPVIDDRLATPSMRAFVDTPVLTAAHCAAMWRHYLGPPGARSDVPAYAAPGRAEDLGGLPPAYVLTAEFDPLRDEGIDYARKLLSHGVPVELHQYPGTFHGFDSLSSAAVSVRAMRETHAALKTALSRASAQVSA